MPGEGTARALLAHPSAPELPCGEPQGVARASHSAEWWCAGTTGGPSDASSIPQAPCVGAAAAVLLRRDSGVVLIALMSLIRLFVHGFSGLLEVRGGIGGPELEPTAARKSEQASEAAACTFARQMTSDPRLPRCCKGFPGRDERCCVRWHCERRRTQGVMWQALVVRSHRCPRHI